MANVAHAAEEFVARINTADVAGLAELMTEDHRFIDATGQAHSGRERMTQGWRQYFALAPDYCIEIEDMVVGSDRVALFGWASGTCNNTPWRIPAAWKAVVRDGLIEEWRIYADVEPMLQSMGIHRFEVG